MKNTISKILIILAFILIGCTTNSVLEEDVINLETEQNIESEALNTNSKTSREKSKLKKNPVNTTANSSYNQRTGFDDGNGNIYDGTNNSGANGDGLYTYLIEFAPNLTDMEKNMIRVPYQAQNDLVYFEQCPNHIDRELWYMNPEVSYGCNTSVSGIPQDCNRTNHPPVRDSESLLEVWHVSNDSCN